MEDTPVIPKEEEADHLSSNFQRNLDEITEGEDEYGVWALTKAIYRTWKK